MQYKEQKVNRRMEGVMRNLLLGFLIGVLTATGAGVWAQSTSGSVFDYGPGNIKTFRDNGTGTTGRIFPYTDTFSTYSDSTGRTGSFYTYPGSGVTTYQFSGGQKPC